MDEEDGGGVPDDIEGLSIADAVDAILARDDARDPEEVRATLDVVAEDGVVSRDAVDSALAHASKVVSTPETRVEIAAMALSDARATAEPVADLDAVQSRLDALGSRLAAIEDRVDELGTDLEDAVEQADDSGDLYGTAARIRRLTEEANDLQRAADDLALDAGEFERWVEDPDRRFRELDGDVDAIEDALDELAATADELTDAAGGDGGDRRGPNAGDVPGPGAVWIDAAFRHRMIDLLLADVRAELDDLRAWGDRDDTDDGRADGIAERIDELDARHAALGERLDGIARSEWTERYGERLAAFESALDGFDPPVAWGSVRAALDEHRSGIEGLG